MLGVFYVPTINRFVGETHPQKTPHEMGSVKLFEKEIETPFLCLDLLEKCSINFEEKKNGGKNGR